MWKHLCAVHVKFKHISRVMQWPLEVAALLIVKTSVLWEVSLWFCIYTFRNASGPSLPSVETRDRDKDIRITKTYIQMRYLYLRCQSDINVLPRCTKSWLGQNEIWYDLYIFWRSFSSAFLCARSLASESSCRLLAEKETISHGDKESEDSVDIENGMNLW